MRWAAQVRHVMVKDVQQARWLVIGYLGVVALAAVLAHQWPGVSTLVYGLSMFVVLITGLFVAGCFVQADSPSRSDAFWASRPLHPMAVLAAKALLVLIVVIAVPLLAQASALMKFDVPLSAALRLLGRSVWMFGVWLLVAMVVAALTRDLRSFSSAMLAAFIILGVVFVAGTLGAFGSLDVSGAGPIGAALPYACIAIGVGGGIALLVMAYRSRVVRRRTIAGSVVTGGCAFLAALMWPQTRAMPADAVKVDPRAYGFTVKVRGVPGDQLELFLDQPQVKLTDRLVALDSAVFTFHTRDGRTVRVPSRVSDVLETSRLPVPHAVKWRGTSPYPTPESRGGATGISLTRRQREALRAGITSASIDATGFVAQPRLIFTLPLQAGASVQREGSGAKIVDLAPAADSSLTLSSWALGRAAETIPEPGLLMHWWRAPRYLLVNERRNEAVVVIRGGSSGSAQALVLPGAWRWAEIMTLMWPRLDGEVEVEADWLRDARLVVVDWEPRGRVSLRGDITVRPESRALPP